ncbi:MAG: hypothetical protein RMN52_12575 [Anaerolineae bacterium]|nr:hypothetical protein [Candidatus Roseilinea sp.]MDW8450826.1 hypothetical protein [Anaerolineae bacterium]
MDTPAIAPAYRYGLKAIAPSDKAKIKCRHPKRLKGSVCVDEALQGVKPVDPRWDYAIGYGHTTNSEQIIWAEVHPAASGDNLKEVRGKLDWLIEWLRTEAQPMNYDPRRIVWVATGSSSFSANDPKLRALRDQGLEFVGGRLEF